MQQATLIVTLLILHANNPQIFSLDLINTPQNPLSKLMIERTAACYLIIYMVNQLFLSSNDIIELGWLEREFYLTDKTKSEPINEFYSNKSEF